MKATKYHKEKKMRTFVKNERYKDRNTLKYKE